MRTAIGGASTCRLSWFDAHIRAYAERFGLDTPWSEDVEDGLPYGSVRVRNPFSP